MATGRVRIRVWITVRVTAEFRVRVKVRAWAVIRKAYMLWLGLS
jgi:hypothetical protein